MNETTIPASKCPTCGYEMDSSTCVDDDTVKPKPGDFSVCMKCGEMLRFTGTMGIRIVELNDMMELTGNNQAQLVHIQRVVRKERVLG